MIEFEPFVRSAVQETEWARLTKEVGNLAIEGKRAASLDRAIAHVQEVIVSLQAAKSLECTERDRDIAISVIKAKELETYIQYWLKP
jgi:hypothetical protein